MKKTILILSALFFVFACDKDEETPAPPSRTELLTDGDQKSWYIYSSTPDDGCSSGSDDTWTFSADGSFEYDHGTITESNNGECGDLINFEGTWAFSNEETEITIIALRATGSTEDMDPVTIASGVVTLLTTDRCVVTSADLQSVELRKR